MASYREIKKSNLNFLKTIFDEGHRSVELYKAIIDNSEAEHCELIINDLARSILSTEEPAAVNGLLVVANHYIDKYSRENCDPIHRSLYELYWSSAVCRSNMNLRMLLAHTDKDVSYLYDDIDEEQRVQIKCCIDLRKKEYDEAIDNITELVKIGNYPTLMTFISLDVDINPQTSEKMCELIDFLSKKPKKIKNMYFRAINIYIKRLFDNKSLDVGNKICEKFDEDFIAAFTKADLYVSQNEDEKLYRFLISDLNNIKQFFPTCHWLFKSAVRLNKTKELEKILLDSGETKDCILELIDSLQEHNNKKSRRSYRFENEIQCQQKLDVVFCINNDYFKGFQASITSFVVNNGSLLNNIRFHIGIDNTIDLENLTGFMEIFDVEYKIHNIEKEYKTDELKIEYGIKTHYVLDKSAYYRIFMFDKLLKDPEITRILYLDSDTLILSNLYELIHRKMDVPLHACCEDQEEISVLKSKEINDIDNYFNSGVLLINAQNDGVLFRIQKCLETIDQQDSLIMHDQCALNIAFKDTFQELESKFNFLIHQHDMNIVNADIFILHLSGRIKPWHSDYHDDEYISNLWFTYYNMAKLWMKKTK